MSGDLERAEDALRHGMDEAYFDQRKARTNGAIEQALGTQLAQIYQIQSDGRRSGRFGLRVGSRGHPVCFGIGTGGIVMSDVHVLLVSAQAAPNLLPTKANDTLFKLSKVCRRVGGLGTRAMLVSYRRLGDAERRLAQALGITTVCGAEIANLDQRLRTWVSP